MNKRVHEIAKERGLAPKEVLDRLQAAGLDVTASSSSVDEAVAQRVLGNGGSQPAAGARPSAKPDAPSGSAPARPAPARNPNLRRVKIDGSGGGGGRSGRSSAPARGSSKPAQEPRTAMPDPRSMSPNLPVDPRRGSGAGGGDPRRGMAPQADPRRGTRSGDSRGGGRQAGAGDPRSQAGRDQAAPSGRQQAAGSRQQPTGSRQQPTGSRQQPTGSRQQPTGARPAPAGRQPAAEPRRQGGSRAGGADRQQAQARQPMPDPREIAAARQPVADPRSQASGGRGQSGAPRGGAAGRQGDARPADAPRSQPEAGAGEDTRTNGQGADARAAQSGDAAHKRPTRDSLQGERTPGSGSGRRRVVIDSQASRRAPGGGGPPQANQPPRRQRRGRRRRGVYNEEVESRPAERAVIDSVIRINSGSTVKDVAEYLGVSTPEVMKKLMALGELKTLTQTLPDDTIEVLAGEFDKEVEIVHSDDETLDEPVFDDAEDDLVERPPVVTIMGHVDHGKTSLLDAVRSTEVAAGEAGGITQHIGAYQVHHNDKVVTFLDTPGHEAFTAMRARGAKVTDIAVIVVAADDGVKPQTQEAVDHAKEAGVPMLVAVNKIDKEGAQPDRVRAEMAQLGLQPVEWGGDTEFVNVSAKTHEGLEDMLETILVMAEVEELRANPNTGASGTVIESKLDPGRGPVVTILIMRGTLEVGDALVAGAHWGRVRAMNDFTGTRVSKAEPGEPVEVLGFDGVPEAGEHVRVVEHERRARQLANERATRLKAESLARRSGKRISLEDIFASGQKELNLVLKSDVAGSLEAIEDEIAKLPQDEVSVNVIRRAVGAVTESDVMLAAASDAVILAFNVRPVGDARAVAEREGVEIRHYAVIYRAIEELRDAMQGMLAPEEVEETVATIEVRQIFRASRVGTIAGCYVTDGRVTRGSKVRLVRDGTVVYTGEIASLRRFNEDVREVASGYECGIVLRDYADIKEGDMIEAYTTRQVERELA